MLQPAFSAGKWLAGFSPLAGEFPFYPTMSGPGAGESPVIVYERCLIDNSIVGAGELGSGTEDPTCRAQAAAAGLALVQFLDNHGEPLTPGRFPRYVPHQRQAWVGTVVSKYTASTDVGIPNIDSNLDNIPDLEGGKINQLFTTMAKTVSDRIVTWFSMSNESGAGCGGGWCQWLWNPNAVAAADRLKRVSCTATSGCPDKPKWTVAGGTSVTDLDGGNAPTNVTSFTVPNEVTGMFVTRDLENFEKAPTEIYQVVGQFVQLGLGQAFGIEDPGAAGAGFPTGVPSQNFWSEFWGLSGPNVQASEGVNPYTWLLCGTNPFGVDVDCKNTAGPSNAPGGATMAITQFGLDPTNRFGGGMAPSADPLTDYGLFDTDSDGYGDVDANTIANCTGFGGAGSACDRGLRTAMVACVVGGDTDNDPRTSECTSIAGGGDNIYGNGPGDILYYKEVVEEGLRGGGIRHDRAIAFSFLNGLGANTGNPGSGLNNSLRQMVSDQQQGFLMSCLNCEDTAQHRIAQHELRYNFTYNQTVPGFFGVHGSGASGSITFQGGEP
jgi:hypothetical protein